MLLWWKGLHNVLKTHPSNEVEGSIPSSSTTDISLNCVAEYDRDRPVTAGKTANFICDNSQVVRRTIPML